MDKDLEQNGKVSRRDFTALSVAAGLSVTAGATPAAALAVTESEVTIKTADGTCDAVFTRPTTGKHPGVLIWTDVFGLRPTFRDMAKRLAGEGYAVLVPNPFYRTQKAPVMEDASKVDFNDSGFRAKMQSWTGPINEDGAIERDAAAYVAFLDAQKEVDTGKKIGTQGYCMGGPLVFKTVATLPDRVRMQGAGGRCFGSVVDSQPGPQAVRNIVHVETVSNRRKCEQRQRSQRQNRGDREGGIFVVRSDGALGRDDCGNSAYGRSNGQQRYQLRLQLE